LRHAAVARAGLGKYISGIHDSSPPTLFKRTQISFCNSVRQVVWTHANPSPVFHLAM
jgi:hypothetical protein